MARKRNSTVDAIFEAFGGTTGLATAIQTPISTAHTWKRKGRIPRWWMAAIQSAAAEKKIDLPAAFKHRGAA